jgi:insertion element IS1 protein InsB
MPKVYGKPAVASWEPDRLDVFIRSKARTLVYAFNHFGVEGAVDMGGALGSDPVAVTRGPGRLDVFARGDDFRCLHWAWDQTLGRMVELPPLPGLLGTDPAPAVLELDEMGHYLKKKSQPLWIWKAWDRASGQLVDWECGSRDKATCERLIERLTRWRTRLSCTDDYAVYDVLPVGQRYSGKNETHGIERDNARQRHWLARFRRRSIVVSKTKRMVDVSLALFSSFTGTTGLTIAYLC